MYRTILPFVLLSAFILCRSTTEHTHTHTNTRNVTITRIHTYIYISIVFSFKRILMKNALDCTLNGRQMRFFVYK